MAPEEMRPKSIDFEVSHVARDSWLNAQAEHKKGDEDHFTLRTMTRADGSWFAEKAYEDEGFGRYSRHAASTEIGSHELGHAVYPKAMALYGEESVKLALSRAGRDDLARQPGEAAKMLRAMHSDLAWSNSVVNESFADAMAVAALAKQMDREDFEKAVGIMKSRRSEAYGAAMDSFDKNKAKQPDGSYISADVHLTLRAVESMAALGYDKLSAMEPKDVVVSALASAHAGFMGMVADQPEVFAKTKSPDAGAAMRQMAQVGAAPALKLGSWRAGRSAQASAEPKLGGPEGRKPGI